MKKEVIDEIIKNSDEHKFIDEMLEEFIYLDSIKDFMYIDVKGDDKLKEVLEDLDSNTYTLNEIMRKSFYLKTIFIWFCELFGTFLGKEFLDNYKEFIDEIENYGLIIEELDNLYNTYEHRRIEDILIADKLFFTSYFTLMNYLKIGDKSLLNIKKYEDSEIKDYRKTIYERKNLLLTLRTRNRSYDKINENEFKKSE